MNPPIPYWRVPRLWEGEVAYIVAGGYSLLKENLELIHDENVIGVNSSFTLGDWVDACWFGDPRFYDWNQKELDEFKGLKACCCAPIKDRGLGIHVLRRGKPDGLDPRPDFVSWNKSSGGSAISFAVHLGVRKIVLLGFDMKPSEEGEDNWHNYHKIKGNVKNPYPRFLRAFPHIRRDAKEMGIEIINCTMNSEIPEGVFPKIPLEEVVNVNSSVCT